MKHSVISARSNILETKPMPNDKLSEREFEIAQVYASGDNYRQIAEALFIAPSTVRTHISTIYRKVGVSSKQELHRALAVFEMKSQESETKIRVQSGFQPAFLALKANSPKSGSHGQQISPQEWHPSIVVLPFKNISGDPHQKSFVEGLTEDIISNLSRVHGLIVIARNSAFSFRDVATNIDEIANELNVRYVLEGSARMSGTCVRVIAHLVDVDNSQHIWTETYDKNLTELFEVQDEITRAVTSSTQTQVVLNEGDQRRARGDTDFQDLRDISKIGWRCIYDLKEESFAQVLVLAEKAKGINPDHASSYQLRAAALYHRALQGYSQNSSRDLAEAREEIWTAINLDDQDEFSYWILGLTAFHGERDVPLAISELRRAIELNPNFSLAHAASGTVYAYAAMFAEAMASSELALRLNPRDPSNFFRYSAMAVAHFTIGKYAEALALAEQSLRSGPSWRVAHIIKIACLSMLGELQKTERGIANFLVHWPKETVACASTLPFADPKHNELIAVCLRKAGMREALSGTD
jgi:adenylate cyclase